MLDTVVTEQVKMIWKRNQSNLFVSDLSYIGSKGKKKRECNYFNFKTIINEINNIEDWKYVSKKLSIVFNKRQNWCFDNEDIKLINRYLNELFTVFDKKENSINFVINLCNGDFKYDIYKELLLSILFVNSKINPDESFYLAKLILEKKEKFNLNSSNILNIFIVLNHIDNKDIARLIIDNDLTSLIIDNVVFYYFDFKNKFLCSEIEKAETNAKALGDDSPDLVQLLFKQQLSQLLEIDDFLTIKDNTISLD